MTLAAVTLADAIDVVGQNLDSWTLSPGEVSRIGGFTPVGPKSLDSWTHSPSRVSRTGCLSLLTWTAVTWAAVTWAAATLVAVALAAMTPVGAGGRE